MKKYEFGPLSFLTNINFPMSYLGVLFFFKLTNEALSIFFSTFKCQIVSTKLIQYNNKENQFLIC